VIAAPLCSNLSTEHIGQWEGGERKPTSSFAGLQLPPGLRIVFAMVTSGSTGGLDSRKKLFRMPFRANFRVADDPTIALEPKHDGVARIICE
jgi:hypothetical protein